MVTPDEYIEFKHNSTEKHEYLDGEIFMMAGAGATPDHNLISPSVYFTLYPQLHLSAVYDQVTI